MGTRAVAIKMRELTPKKLWCAVESNADRKTLITMPPLRMCFHSTFFKDRKNADIFFAQRCNQGSGNVTKQKMRINLGLVGKTVISRDIRIIYSPVWLGVGEKGIFCVHEIKNPICVSSKLHFVVVINVDIRHHHTMYTALWRLDCSNNSFFVVFVFVHFCEWIAICVVRRTAVWMWNI